MKKIINLKRVLSLFVLIAIVGTLLANCAPAPGGEAQATGPVTEEGTMPPTKPSQDEALSGEVRKSNLQRVMSPDIGRSDLDELVAGNSAFAFNMYQAIREQDRNLFYSPYSISLALAMAYAGALDETKEQLEDALHFTLSQESLHPAFNALDLQLAQRSEQVPAELGTGFQLNVANSIWAQEDHPFREEYLDLIAVNYGAGLRLADFINAAENARQAINNWVSQETEGRIKDLIPAGAINSLTRLVLANAIYFKASWEHTFEKDSTQEGEFTLLDGSHVQVPMMTYSQPNSFAYAKGNGYQAVELPYVGGQVAMLLLIPDTDQFSTFEESLSADQVGSITDALQDKNVLLTMPKFSFESQFGLADTLRDMGMPAAFDPDQANFSGMDSSRDLFISDVIHKAFVDVNEEGTEAAAATAVVVGVTSLPVVDVELTIDRPFIFLIRDTPTGSILFIGRVLNPAQ